MLTRGHHQAPARIAGEPVYQHVVIGQRYRVKRVQCGLAQEHEVLDPQRRARLHRQAWKQGIGVAALLHHNAGHNGGRGWPRATFRVHAESDHVANLKVGDDLVAPGPEREGKAVPAATAVQHVVTDAAAQHVPAATAIQHVVASPAAQQVVAAPATQFVVTVLAAQLVVAPPAHEQVGAATAPQIVGAVGAGLFRRLVSRLIRRLVRHCGGHAERG